MFTASAGKMNYGGCRELLQGIEICAHERKVIERMEARKKKFSSECVSYNQCVCLSEGDYSAVCAFRL